MQFIQEFTLIQKGAVGATLALIMVLLLVSARRRRAAAGVPEGAQEPAAAKTRKRDGKKQATLPGRKRRKLAAEAAHSMGVDSEPSAVAQVPEVPTINIPEVVVVSPTVVEAPVEEVFDDVPNTEPIAIEPVAVPTMVDPYLHETQVDEEGVVVAQPGWPAPGELASSFDLDAFDPLPEAYGPLKEETYDESSAPAAHGDDTTAIEMPELSTTGEVAALEEIEEWTDTFDGDESWDEADDEVTAESGWTDSQEEEPRPEVAAIAGPPAIDMENIWSQPDEEPLWDVAEVVEASVTDVPAVADIDGAEPVWTDDSHSWQEDVFETPAVLEIPAPVHEVPAYEPSVPAAWSGSIGGPNSPVVLDLAGLAASGHSLELVIEPNGDGHGVRLRFGAPGANPVEVPVVLPDAPEAAVDGVAEADITVGIDDTLETEPVDVDPVEPEIDVSFLAGVAPGDASPVAAEPVRVAVMPAPVVESAYFFEPAVAEAQGPNPVAVDPAPSVEDSAMRAAPAPATTATAVMDADDDPARILADIRARLAALDARR